jgi:hypothetical protein
MLEKRENANYVEPRFPEPTVPEHYEQIVAVGIRTATAAYLQHPNILTFDKEHAIVSFPLAVLRAAGTAAIAAGYAQVSEDERDFIRVKARERKGVLSPLTQFILGTIRTG